MAQRIPTEMVTVTVRYDDGSRIEFDCLHMNVIAFGVLESLDLASTTRRVFDKDGNEQEAV